MPYAEARVQSPIVLVGFVVGKLAPVHFFLWVIQFFLSVSHHTLITATDSAVNRHTKKRQQTRHNCYAKKCISTLLNTNKNWKTHIDIRRRV
jgi:hypothetical protein